jgi:ATP-dependent protease Clp ATPase subunit
MIGAVTAWITVLVFNSRSNRAIWSPISSSDNGELAMRANGKTNKTSSKVISAKNLHPLTRAALTQSERSLSDDASDLSSSRKSAVKKIRTAATGKSKSVLKSLLGMKHKATSHESLTTQQQHQQRYANLRYAVTSSNCKNDLSMPTPYEMMMQLNDNVVGQEQVKVALTVGIYNHYKRLNDGRQIATSGSTETAMVDKSNIMLLGPTGTGKTLLLRSLAKIIDVPLVITDATSLTQAGYVGDDVESLLSKLYIASKSDSNRCERGIVFIDEVDKLTKRVQQALLKIVEGNVINVPNVPKVSFFGYAFALG